MDYYIPYVKLFPDSLDLLELLGDAERGRLFTAVLIYAQTGEVGHLSGNERFIFPAFKGQIDRDVRNLRELSAAKSAAKAESGRKGAAARWGGADTSAAKAMASMANDGKNGTCHKNMANMANDGENGYKDKDKDKDEDKDKDSILTPDGVSAGADVSAPPTRGTEAESPPSKPKARKLPRKKYGEHGWVRLTDAEYERLLRDLGQAELDRCIQYVDESAQGNGNKNGWKDWNIIVRKCHRQGWGVSCPSQRSQKPKSAMWTTGLTPMAEKTPERQAQEERELEESMRQMQKMLAEMGGGDGK